LRQKIQYHNRSSFQRKGRDLRKGRAGVSEIIGNLLILAITVTLFSSVLFFVINMPQPQTQTISDFKVQTEVSGASLFINITHEGGQTLNGSSTNIYLYRNDVPTTLSISSSVSNIGSDWDIGEVWSYIVPGYSSSMAVRLMVVDRTSNSIVWQATLADTTSSQNVPPIIGSRGLMPTPVIDQDKVHFFVTVPLRSDNVRTAWVDASALGLAGNVTLYDADHDGTFTSSDSYNASFANWNGRTILFYLNDNSGNVVPGQFTVIVVPGYSGSGNGGGNATNGNQTTLKSNAPL
jgi:hypothetical protein